MKDMRTITAPRFFLCVLLLFMLNGPCFSIGGDTFSAGQSLSVSQTLVSQRNIFELGFFNKGNSLSVFLGIWYKRFDDQIVVWVANREQSLSDPNSLQLELSGDGNLALKSGSRTTWSTDFKPLPPNSTEAVLLDDGNFVVRDVSNPSTIHWQSFDYPTDTWLPGAKLGINKLTGETQVLTSWKSSEDPASGMFSVGIDPNQTSQYFIEWNKSIRYWSSGLWNGERFSSIPEMRLNYIFNFSFVSNERESYFTYSIYDNDILSRLVMDSSGQVRQLTWLAGVWNWNLFWTQPREQSQVYAFCGAFGIFRENFSTPCVCLQGFEPFSIEAAKLNDWSGGCVRKAALQCRNSAHGFLTISNMQFPANSKAFHAGSFEVCKSACMQNCSCTAYAYNESGCLVWEGALLNLQQLLNGSNTKQAFYLKLAASEFQNAGGDRKKLWIITAVLVPLIVLIAGGFICCLCRRKLKQRGENNSSEDLLLFDFSANANAAAETNIRNNLTTGGKKDVELPLFSFVSVSAATDNFSLANKLGEGGFGPVYKGKLLKGQEIAVKRLSKRSGQGLQEFKNEALVIAKLQHRNLVRLLGCCSERDEYILIYEYMPNRSLDFYLFDPKKQEVLDWSTRLRIIEGIAQGLLYLHQYSRLRIIHRDLKASNVLLDSEMNPKISDFGMARIFGGNESQANTNRIVGTYGYMSPEYALEGLFSIKSDVFSFGVLLIEIVSGKKNTGFYNTDSLNLLGYTWELWNADRGLELMDPLLGHPFSTSTFLRLVNIGLLCVQGNPTDRPTMSDVVSMLNNEYAPLPKPKQPAFSTTATTNTNSSLRYAGNCSVNNVTMSLIEAR